jgi:hypothetical protein
MLSFSLFYSDDPASTERDAGNVVNLSFATTCVRFMTSATLHQHSYCDGHPTCATPSFGIQSCTAGLS